ncbi:MAG: alpha/beta fold hydrolase [Candidatus Hermodarchaeota archaeon]
MSKIPIFQYEDIEVNYLKRGKGKPLVLLQGLGQTIDSWTFQIPYFKRKMMVIALDNRGVGKSSRPNYPYTMEMFVNETKALLDFLEIKEKIHLMGVSMGGMIAQNFVLKYPEMVKTLILLATSPKMDPTSLIDEYKSFDKMDVEDVYKKKLELMFSDSFIKDIAKDEKLTDLLKKKLVIESTTTIQDYINRGAAISGHNTRKLLNKIQQPTLILAGTKDKLIPYEQSEFLHSKIPNSKLELIADYGHGSVLVESPEKINGIIWDFIESHLD